MPHEVTLTPDVYREARARLAGAGYVSDWEWSQNLRPPTTAEALACEYTWVVLNSGMRNSVARRIMDRVWPLLIAGQSIAPAFGHPGKTTAIEDTWRRRVQRFDEFFAEFLRPEGDVVAWCESLPWIGPITKYHLAKSLGVDCAKPDRWLVRLAAATRETVHDLCARLATASGDRVATVDVVLWRACATGILVIDDGVVRLTGGIRP